MRLIHLFLPALAFFSAVTSFGQDPTRQGSVMTEIAGQVGNVLKPAKVYSKSSLGSKAYFDVKTGDRLIVNASAPKGWVKVKVTVGFGYIQAGAVKLGEQVELPADQVGQIVRNAKVYKAADTNAKSYFSVDAKDTIVVKADGPDGWTKVALSTGDYGYIENDAVTLLAMAIPREQLESQIQPTVSRGSTMSRGGVARGSRNAREAAAETGLDYLGVSYVWGGNDIENGIDCSGFVQQLF